MSDPTLETLAGILGPDYVLVPNVPVFDEHKEYDENGKLVREFGRPQLEEIGEQCNLREEATGDLSPIGPGHTVRGEVASDGSTRPTAESNQPPVWGYARNWKVQPFGPAGRLALCPDFYIRRDKLEEFKTYPRRSVELWHKAGFIDWIALLRRTPMRDLGLISHVPDETRIIPRYLQPKAEKAAAYERGVGLLLYAMESNMDLAVNPGDAPAGGGLGTAGLGMSPEQMAAHCYAAITKYGPLLEHLHGKYAAEMGGGAPSGTNTFVPGAGGPSGEPSKPSGPSGPSGEPSEPSRHSMQTDPLRYAALERTVADLQKKNDEWVTKYQRAERKGKLESLAHQYAVNVDEELADCEGMTDVQFDKHCQRIVKHYGRSITGGEIRLHDGPVEGVQGPKPATREQVAEAVKRTSAKGNQKSFADHLKDVRGQTA